LILLPAIAVGAAVIVIGLIVKGAGTAKTHRLARPHKTRIAMTRPPISSDPVLARLGLRPLRGRSPLPGYLLIADRDNNRLIIVNPAKRIVWRFPARGAAQSLSGPDDAFVSADGRYISSNEEFAETIVIVKLSRHASVVWRYGHQGVQGSAAGYLAHPDDAYLLPNGRIQVADIINCRVLWLNRRRRIVRSIGSAGNCVHSPPGALSDPNGDTPLPDGGLLVTEIGGWVDRFNHAGRLLWSIRTPTDYPSDAQLLRNGDVLVAGYDNPGRIDILTPRGRVVWTYERTSGPGALNKPSLAVMLPNGMIAATDDWNDRVVVINPRSKHIVWQYGHSGVPGSRPGYLRKPDGLDLLP
jgi:putative pyrroloquinoline-quinone binding quinoprotein